MSRVQDFASKGTTTPVTEVNTNDRGTNGVAEASTLMEAKYKALINSIPGAIYICDKEGYITFFNSTAEKLWGYRPNIKESSIKFCACFKVWSLDGQYIPPDQTPMAMAIATGQSCRNVEAIVERPDGCRFYASVNIESLYDDNGNFAGAVNIFQDISDRKKYELRLIEGGKELEKLVDTIPSIVWITDENAHCTFLNRRWYEYTGQTKEEAMGLGWLEATHPDDKANAERIFLTASSCKEGFTLHYRLRTKTGEYRWNVDSGVPRYDHDGKFVGYIGSVIDVHEERLATEKIEAAQEEMRHALEKLRIATESADVGTWSLNVKTKKLDWSNIHKRLWGYDEHRDDLTYEDWHSVILKEDKEKAFEQVGNAEKQKVQYENLYQIRRANDGEIRWIRSIGQYFYNEHGEPIFLTGISIDITDRKTVEERFKSLAETLPQLVWMTDERGNFVYTSRKWEDYSLVNPKSEGAWDKVIHPDDNAIVMDAWKVSLSTGKSFFVEARLRNQKGEYRWHVGKGEPLRNHESTIVNWIGAYSDIHDLIDARQQLDTAFKQLPAAIYLYDGSQKLIYANALAAKLSGFSSVEELLGIKDFKNAPISGYTVVEENGKELEQSEFTVSIAARTKQMAEKVLKFIHHDSGEVKWYLSRCSPQLDEDGEVTLLLTTVTDITAQKKSELLIRENEEKFRLLIEAFPQMAWMADAQGNPVYFNNRYLDYTGLKKEEALGGKASRIIHPEDWANNIDTWNRHIREGLPIELELRYWHKEAQAYEWFLVRVVPVFEDNGKIQHWVGTSTNIQHLKNISAVLEKEVQDRTRELRIVNQKLEAQTLALKQSNEDLQQFAHVTSHDLKEPVRKIRLYGNMLAAEAQSLTPAAANLVSKMNRLLKDLTTSSEEFSITRLLTQATASSLTLI